MPRVLVLATNNPGKVGEIKAALHGLCYELQALPHLGIALDVAETGATYADNAAAKALAAARACGQLALADDSGLEVDALNGAPGVHTSRYFGANLSDAEKVQRLLESLDRVDSARRRARFRCVMALAWPGSTVEFFEGACEGILTGEPRGQGGFGFDPIFIPDRQTETFAELPSECKAQMSHRARALARVRQFLETLAETETF